MELVMTVITITCIVLSALLAPCVSLQAQVQSFSKQVQNHDEPLYEPSIILPTLPRKLRFAEEVSVVVGQAHVTSMTKSNNKKEKVSGSYKLQNKEKEDVVLHGSPTTTWKRSSSSAGRENDNDNDNENEDDVSNFFTVDYQRVKRRPPIHNKSLPVGP